MPVKRTEVKTFSEILQDMQKSGIINQKTKQAADWFTNYVKQFKGTIASKLMSQEKAYLTTQVQIGRMYCFFYDPKMKATLPYYDRFPCIFPIERYDNGFLGLNLHYLPPQLRVKLMDALFSLENNSKIPENKKLVISYKILKSLSEERLFAPCVKRYLRSHVKSRFLEVPYDAWAITSLLPVSQFEGASVTQIWSDSRKRIK